MKLGHKLMIAPLVTALVVFSVGQLDAWLLSGASKQAVSSFQNHIGEVRTLGAVKSEVSTAHVEVYRMMTIIGSMEEAAVQDKRKGIAARGQAVAEQLQKQLAAEPEGSELRKGMETAAQQLAAYFKQTDAAIDLASVDPNTGVAAMQGADEAYAALVKSLGAIESALIEHSEKDAAAGAASATRMHWVLTLVSLLATVGVLVLAWLMQRKVAHALASASQAARAVADGDLKQTMVVDRRDELGDLQKALADMKAALLQTVTQVRQASDGINVASREIASGNQDLSARTEQAASNLEETAASMEQLTSTVRNSADAARQANQLAASASQVAVRGGEVVQQVVSTMDEINHSSKKISDIIGVIDGIAFQTNILALNAAVEAARAGEQGRGFAVVAGEVRNLAQRSAEAAKEIKGLIGASVDKVEAGSRLVGEAGQTMSEIVGSIQRVSDIVGEITAAAGEQSDGIGQVNTAVNQLDQMTQQNAALVEESAAAAESLKDQAARLAQVVAVFRLDAHASTPAVAPTPVSAGRALTTQTDPVRHSPPKALGKANSRATPAPKAAALPKPAAPKAAPVLTAAAPAQAPAAPKNIPVPATAEGDWESF